MLKKIKNNVTFLNTLSSLLLQILTLINGFIIPKLILVYFGSEVNGLVASLTKFLSYVSILEGGITGVVMANLYKPLADKDLNKISSIVNTTRNFYRKIAYIFAIYAIVLSVIYPFIFKTNFSYMYVFTLTIILAITSVIQYNFSLTMKTLLNADKKVYVVAFTQSVALVLNVILAIISLKIYPSIHFLKILSALVFLLQPIMFNFYGKKLYALDEKANKDVNLLKSRWDGFSINIAAFIHTNTDVLILSLFSSMNMVSVYSVYALVGSGLRTIIQFLSNGISPTIGRLYAKGEMKQLEERFEIYEYLIFMLVFLIFSVAIFLLCPFVMIYTKNISDTNYYQPIFGIILMLSEGFYLIKNAHLDLAYNANKFKELTLPCYIEAGINIIISLVLVNKIGLIGIATGTLIAMIYRMIYQVWFSKKILINRKQNLFYKKLISFTMFAILGSIICKFIVPKVEYNIFSWLWHGVVYICIFGLMYLINSLIFYKKELTSLKKYLKV